MAGKQVLRIETRERLRPGNARHVAGLVRDPTARPVPEPVIALGGADYAAARKALRTAPRRPGRRPCEAVELVLAGPPPFDGTGGAPWAPEREREWAHAAYAGGRSILGPESVVAAVGWHRDEAAPHIHVLAVPRPEGGGGRIGWCAVRDAAVSKICGGRRAGSRYRVLQDDLHARVSHRFGLGRGEVGSEALHEAIDRAKAVEARARLAQREAAQAAQGMLAAHAQHEAQLARIGRSMEKEAELDLRTARAQERAEAAEAEAERAVERARQAGGAGTHAEGVAACFRAMHVLLHACGMWPKLMAWTPFRIWAEKARGGEVADVEGAIEADRARRRAPASGMER